MRDQTKSTSHPYPDHWECWPAIREPMLLHLPPDVADSVRELGRVVYELVDSLGLYRPPGSWTAARLGATIAELRFLRQYLEDAVRGALRQLPRGGRYAARRAGRGLGREARRAGRRDRGGAASRSVGRGLEGRVSGRGARSASCPPLAPSGAPFPAPRPSRFPPPPGPQLQPIPGGPGEHPRAPARRGRKHSRSSRRQDRPPQAASGASALRDRASRSGKGRARPRGHVPCSLRCPRMAILRPGPRPPPPLGLLSQGGLT